MPLTHKEVWDYIKDKKNSVTTIRNTDDEIVIDVVIDVRNNPNTRRYQLNKDGTILQLPNTAILSDAEAKNALYDIANQTRLIYQKIKEKVKAERKDAFLTIYHDGNPDANLNGPAEIVGQTHNMMPKKYYEFGCDRSTYYLPSDKSSIRIRSHDGKMAEVIVIREAEIIFDYYQKVDEIFKDVGQENLVQFNGQDYLYFPSADNKRHFYISRNGKIHKQVNNALGEEINEFGIINFAKNRADIIKKSAVAATAPVAPAATAAATQPVFDFVKEAKQIVAELGDAQHADIMRENGVTYFRMYVRNELICIDSNGLCYNLDASPGVEKITFGTATFAPSKDQANYITQNTIDGAKAAKDAVLAAVRATPNPASPAATSGAAAATASSSATSAATAAAKPGVVLGDVPGESVVDEETTLTAERTRKIREIFDNPDFKKFHDGKRDIGDDGKITPNDASGNFLRIDCPPTYYISDSKLYRYRTFTNNLSYAEEVAPADYDKAFGEIAQRIAYKKRVKTECSAFRTDAENVLSSLPEGSDASQNRGDLAITKQKVKNKSTDSSEIITYVFKITLSGEEKRVGIFSNGFFSMDDNTVGKEVNPAEFDQCAAIARAAIVATRQTIATLAQKADKAANGYSATDLRIISAFSVNPILQRVLDKVSIAADGAISKDSAGDFKHFKCPSVTGISYFISKDKIYKYDKKDNGVHKAIQITGQELQQAFDAIAYRIEAEIKLNELINFTRQNPNANPALQILNINDTDDNPISLPVFITTDEAGNNVRLAIFYEGFYVLNAQNKAPENALVLSPKFEYYMHKALAITRQQALPLQQPLPQQLQPQQPLPPVDNGLFENIKLHHLVPRRVMAQGQNPQESPEFKAQTNSDWNSAQKKSANIDIDRKASPAISAQVFWSPEDKLFYGVQYSDTFEDGPASLKAIKYVAYDVNAKPVNPPQDIAAKTQKAFEGRNTPSVEGVGVFFKDMRNQCNIVDFVPLLNNDLNIKYIDLSHEDGTSYRFFECGALCEIKPDRTLEVVRNGVEQKLTELKNFNADISKARVRLNKICDYLEKYGATKAADGSFQFSTYSLYMGGANDEAIITRDGISKKRNGQPNPPFVKIEDNENYPANSNEGKNMLLVQLGDIEQRLGRILLADLFAQIKNDNALNNDAIIKTGQDDDTEIKIRYENKWYKLTSGGELEILDSQDSPYGNNINCDILFFERLIGVYKPELAVAVAQAPVANINLNPQQPQPLAQTQPIINSAPAGNNGLTDDEDEVFFEDLNLEEEPEASAATQVVDVDQATAEFLAKLKTQFSRIVGMQDLYIRNEVELFSSIAQTAGIKLDTRDNSYHIPIEQAEFIISPTNNQIKKIVGTTVSPLSIDDKETLLTQLSALHQTQDQVLQQQRAREVQDAEAARLAALETARRDAEERAAILRAAKLREEQERALREQQEQDRLRVAREELLRQEREAARLEAERRAREKAEAERRAREAAEEQLRIQEAERQRVANEAKAKKIKNETVNSLIGLCTKFGININPPVVEIDTNDNTQDFTFAQANEVITALNTFSVIQITADLAAGTEVAMAETLLAKKAQLLCAITSQTADPRIPKTDRVEKTNQDYTQLETTFQVNGIDYKITIAGALLDDTDTEITDLDEKNTYLNRIGAVINTAIQEYETAKRKFDDLVILFDVDGTDKKFTSNGHQYKIDANSKLFILGADNATYHEQPLEIYQTITDELELQKAAVLRNITNFYDTIADPANAAALGARRGTVGGDQKFADDDAGDYYSIAVDDGTTYLVKQDEIRIVAADQTSKALSGNELEAASQVITTKLQTGDLLLKRQIRNLHGELAKYTSLNVAKTVGGGNQLFAIKENGEYIGIDLTNLTIVKATTNADNNLVLSDVSAQNQADLYQELLDIKLEQVRVAKSFGDLFKEIRKDNPSLIDAQGYFALQLKLSATDTDFRIKENGTIEYKSAANWVPYWTKTTGHNNVLGLAKNEYAKQAAEIAKEKAEQAELAQFYTDFSAQSQSSPLYRDQSAIFTVTQPGTTCFTLNDLAITKDATGKYKFGRIVQDGTTNADAFSPAPATDLEIFKQSITTHKATETREKAKAVAVYNDQSNAAIATANDAKGNYRLLGTAANQMKLYEDGRIFKADDSLPTVQEYNQFVSVQEKLIQDAKTARDAAKLAALKVASQAQIAQYLRQLFLNFEAGNALNFATTSNGDFEINDATNANILSFHSDGAIRTRPSGQPLTAATEVVVEADRNTHLAYLRTQTDTIVQAARSKMQPILTDITTRLTAGSDLHNSPFITYQRTAAGADTYKFYNGLSLIRGSDGSIVATNATNQVVNIYSAKTAIEAALPDIINAKRNATTLYRELAGAPPVNPVVFVMTGNDGGKNTLTITDEGVITTQAYPITAAPAVNLQLNSYTQTITRVRENERLRKLFIEVDKLPTAKSDIRTFNGNIAGLGNVEISIDKFGGLTLNQLGTTATAAPTRTRVIDPYRHLVEVETIVNDKIAQIKTLVDDVKKMYNILQTGVDPYIETGYHTDGHFEIFRDGKIDWVDNAPARRSTISEETYLVHTKSNYLHAHLKKKIAEKNTKDIEIATKLADQIVNQKANVLVIDVTLINPAHEELLKKLFADCKAKGIDCYISGNPPIAIPPYLIGVAYDVKTLDASINLLNQIKAIEKRDAATNALIEPRVFLMAKNIDEILTTLNPDRTRHDAEARSEINKIEGLITAKRNALNIITAIPVTSHTKQQKADFKLLTEEIRELTGKRDAARAKLLSVQSQFTASNPRNPVVTIITDPQISASLAGATSVLNSATAEKITGHLEGKASDDSAKKLYERIKNPVVNNAAPAGRQPKSNKARTAQYEGAYNHTTYFKIRSELPDHFVFEATYNGAPKQYGIAKISNIPSQDRTHGNDEEYILYTLDTDNKFQVITDPAEEKFCRAHMNSRIDTSLEYLKHFTKVYEAIENLDDNHAEVKIHKYGRLKKDPKWHPVSVTINGKKKEVQALMIETENPKEYYLFYNPGCIHRITDPNKKKEGVRLYGEHAYQAINKIGLKLGIAAAVALPAPVPRPAPAPAPAPAPVVPMTYIKKGDATNREYTAKEATIRKISQIYQRSTRGAGAAAALLQLDRLSPELQRYTIASFESKAQREKELEGKAPTAISNKAALTQYLIQKKSTNAAKSFDKDNILQGIIFSNVHFDNIDFSKIHNCRFNHCTFEPNCKFPATNDPDPKRDAHLAKITEQEAKVKAAEARNPAGKKDTLSAASLEQRKELLELRKELTRLKSQTPKTYFEKLSGDFFSDCTFENVKAKTQNAEFFRDVINIVDPATTTKYHKAVVTELHAARKKNLSLIDIAEIEKDAATGEERFKKTPKAGHKFGDLVIEAVPSTKVGLVHGAETKQSGFKASRLIDGGRGGGPVV